MGKRIEDVSVLLMRPLSEKWEQPAEDLLSVETMAWHAQQHLEEAGKVLPFNEVAAQFRVEACVEDYWELRPTAATLEGQFLTIESIVWHDVNEML